MVLLKSDQHALQPGERAPDFYLKNTDEKCYSLAYFAGKALVVIFMCNHCPYVIPKMNEIADIQNEYKKKGVVVLCINANDPTNYPEDDFDHMKQVARDYGYLYYLFDESQETAKAYGAVCTPDIFVFDNSHTLVYHGRINDAMDPGDKPVKHDLREVLDRIVDGKKVKEWFVPSQGCSIKWK